MSQNVSKRQEAVRVGQVIVVAQPNQEQFRLTLDRAVAQGYQVRETPHFVVCQKSSSKRVMVMHAFRQEDIDADLICLTEQELSSVGLLTSQEEYGRLLYAILASPFPAPRHQQAIWQRFCENSLARLRVLLSDPVEKHGLPISHLVPFAALYQRVFDLFVGSSFLDVGSCFGFLPLLMAERMPKVKIVGCDTNAELMAVASTLAREVASSHLQFTTADVLSESFRQWSPSDTVTAIHLLEHLSEKEIPVALGHLLQVTTRRLLVAVPYETTAQPLYGHVQVFTKQKLHDWGKWCLERLGGSSRYWCEEIMGGMLIIERFAE